MKWGDANHAKREILDASALCSAHMEAFTAERLGKRSWKNSVVARPDRVVSGGFTARRLVQPRRQLRHPAHRSSPRRRLYGMARQFAVE
jgi:hypothetical protein